MTKLDNSMTDIEKVAEVLSEDTGEITGKAKDVLENADQTFAKASEAVDATRNAAQNIGDLADPRGTLSIRLNRVLAELEGTSRSIAPNRSARKSERFM